LVIEGGGDKLSGMAVCCTEEGSPDFIAAKKKKVRGKTYPLSAAWVKEGGGRGAAGFAD